MYTLFCLSKGRCSVSPVSCVRGASVAYGPKEYACYLIYLLVFFMYRSAWVENLQVRKSIPSTVHCIEDRLQIVRTFVENGREPTGN